VVNAVSDITASLIVSGTVALQRDEAWLKRRCWASDAFARLFNDPPAVPLDG
jgi:hypothetical protein